MKIYNGNGKNKCPEARKILAMYVQTTGSDAEIFNHNFQLQEREDGDDVESRICRHCTGASGGATGGVHCRAMHTDAMRESGREGQSLAYQCELGLAFWVSPIYNGSALTGFLRGSAFADGNTDGSAGGIIAGDAAESALAAKSNGTISPQEFIRRVSEVPRCGGEKIQSLAEMLLICARSLSGGSENYHETLRQRCRQMAAISAWIEELKARYPDGSVPPDYPLDKERCLVASLRRGDKNEAEKLLGELLALLVFRCPDHFQKVQLRALELALVLARAGTSSGIAGENNAPFIKQIQEAKTIEELSGALHGMAESITTQVTLYQGIPHASAIRKAERYIQKNLSRKISLREIAKFVGLSAPYFSTVFKEEMGENLSKYINRLRVEMAGKLLLETKLSLNDIAYECCLEDQSWFSKIFKSFTGLSPGKYRSQGGMAQGIAKAKTSCGEPQDGPADAQSA
ncbi:MAG: helix-turn-helix domain-containing protein [Treponema sp.]|jgi:AraC-like DNA-binding protein/ligand-binding sensor protein|nr:helix-turn-helix domain-containing protein [Treponema sp.]